MTIFAAFAGRDLHNARSLLLHAQNNGVNAVTDLLKIVEKETVDRDHTMSAAPGTRAFEKCPDCGVGMLVPGCSSIPGPKRVVCKKCLYSKVIS